MSEPVAIAVGAVALLLGLCAQLSLTLPARVRDSLLGTEAQRRVRRRQRLSDQLETLAAREAHPARFIIWLFQLAFQALVFFLLGYWLFTMTPLLNQAGQFSLGGICLWAGANFLVGMALAVALRGVLTAGASTSIAQRKAHLEAKIQRLSEPPDMK